jgi:hypothetical protein
MTSPSWYCASATKSLRQQVTYDGKVGFPSANEYRLLGRAGSLRLDVKLLNAPFELQARVE